jgi:hypothetical protein
MDDKIDTTKELFTSVSRQYARMEKELRKLTENPEYYDIAQALTDALDSGIEYLCHYRCAVDHNGKEVDIIDVMTRMTDELRDEFKKLTGRPYVPSIVRQVKWNKEHKDNK